MFETPLGGEICATVGEPPHAAPPAIVKERIDEFEVRVASHCACATTDQKTRPDIFGTECDACETGAYAIVVRIGNENISRAVDRNAAEVEREIQLRVFGRAVVAGEVRIDV